MSDDHGIVVADESQIMLLPEKPDIEPVEVHPVLAALIDKKLDVDTIREAMAIQRDHEADEARKAYTRDFTALQVELPASVEQDKTVDFTFNGKRTYYTHASLSAAMDAVKPLLSKFHFALAWYPRTTDRGLVKVTCRITHRAGHFEETELVSEPDKKGGKNAPQAVASTVTFLSRYTALSMLGIATKDMREPHGPPEDSGPAPGDDELADPLRVEEYLNRLGRHGIEIDEALVYMETPQDDWTVGDVKQLNLWVRQQRAERSK